MARLADYFVVVGYDQEKERSGSSQGKIIQRFPEKDWEDCPFTSGIELFCQPSGWSLSTQRQQPTFFISVLTNVEGDRHYCACLTFHETVSMTPNKPDDEDTDDNTPIRHSLMFAPKSLVLVSRQPYYETFRSCLGLIYTVHIENMQFQLETLIGNILGCIQVPPPGGPQIRFSIGAGDRQALQPQLNSTIPHTGSAVYMLFKQLGVNNVIRLFCAIMTDHKLLFHSQSYSRLTDASHAITSLMYPLKYSYVYIPLLPASLSEILTAPTPFLAGVHSTLKHEIAELLDVIVADLDGGSIYVPECVNIPVLPEPVYSRTVQALTMILDHDLLVSDYAFPPCPLKPSSHLMQDKELRAVFLRLFAELLAGYRSCLTIIRIHPEPFITFHKANFLGHRAMVEDDFLTRVLDSTAFGTFVAERGPPYRVCDVFDETYATLPETLKDERNSPIRMLEHIRELAQQLYINENPNPQPYVQKIPKPTDGAYSRIHQPQFPIIDWVHVQEIIDDGQNKLSIKNKLSQLRPQQPRIVPMGPHITTTTDKLHVLNNNARRLEVLRNCVNFVFENKISDARKIFPAVLRALKSKVARLALTQELAFHVQSNRAMLEHQQFDLVVRLLNCALQHDSSMDENGVAAAILPLATAFCRKLCTGVIQFAYTCIQEHPVWANQQFWEATFYQDVQKQIKQLYVAKHDNKMRFSPEQESKSLSAALTLSPMTSSRDSTSEFSSSWGGHSWLRDHPNDPRRRSITSIAYLKNKQVSALEIAAEQLRKWPGQSEENQQEMIANEESTVYSQAIHYSNRMVYLRVPLDASKGMQTMMDEHSTSNSNVTNSIAESDSIDAESGFDEQQESEVGAAIIRFVTRFVDKVCTESGVTPEHIRSLHSMIPGVVAMHVETLEAVNRESKRLPPIQKPKILTPTLLPGEEIIMEGLRVYLLTDGREEGIGGSMGGPAIIPAEGAIFLTTYRVIFKGTPCDPLACELNVTRSFPVSTVTKEKKLSSSYLSHIDQWLQDLVQLRSNTFQMLKVGFDEEVGSENVETFRKLLGKIRNPTSVLNTFAFSGQAIAHSTPLQKHKEKHASLKGFAKRTLLKTARKAGIKTTKSSTAARKQKYVLPTPPTARRSYGLGDSDTESRPGSVVDESEYAAYITSDPKNLEKLADRICYRDFHRLGLGTLTFSSTKSKGDPFRITTVNATYAICRSYPALLAVPQTVTDDSLRKFARSHRQCRFPVISWHHPKTKALLLRASGFHSKGMMGMFKTHHNPTPGPASGEITSTSVEQEKYFHALVQCTPLALGRYGGSLRDRQNRQAGSLEVGMRLAMKTNGAVDNGQMMDPSVQGLNKASLYVFGEKNQVKGIKADAFPKCEFIPVDFYDVRHVKASFKKLLRACVPSAPQSDPEHGFFKAVEESEWLPQLQSVMQLAGAVVDLIDLQGSSVMVALEDGWDITTQIISLAQICLDPYYRTLKGFQTLVEKEWLSFGHRFTHRSNQTAANQASGFAPIFLQFLDCVHQIHRQFPLSFEFNGYFLQFLAYHYVSNRFRTFMLDCECERMEHGWLLDEKQKTSKIDGASGGPETGFTQRHASGQSVWEYIEKYHRRSPIFYNFQYIPLEADNVLRPCPNVANLVVWEYYMSEDLAHGPSYDLEIIAKEKKLAEEEELIDGPATSSKRRLVNNSYDTVWHKQPDCFSLGFQEMHKLQTELEHLPMKWRTMWETLDHPQNVTLQRQMSLNTRITRMHGRSIHKRSTIELLIRGKLAGEASKTYGQNHRFEKYDFTTPTNCDHCNHLLWGFYKQGMSVKCTDCGYNCHEKCMQAAPKNCAKLRGLSEARSSTVTLSSMAPSEPSSPDATIGIQASREMYRQFSANVQEHRTHEGYLYKQGALLKGWKQRWFVLDSMKHQLRYYDAMEDSACKGFIDLAEVVGVSTVKNVQGAPKKTDDNAFFEMRTVKRSYTFCAPNATAAQEWIEKINSCIQ